ncbi:hypothetical protein ACIBCS_41485 [Streptomyces phaeochromogenes]|uniref:hypothetical protein n=1 Tax=Streptomyces phaeochromogenes TaxID=1923 RepID=UPI0033DEAE02
MDENGVPVSGFDPEQYARVERAAQVVGKTPQVFVRDAALAAADAPFIKALVDAGARVGTSRRSSARRTREPPVTTVRPGPTRRR